jgi:hypothetical protein
MIAREPLQATTLATLMVLATVAGGSVALSGTSAGQQGFGTINVLSLQPNDPVTEGDTLVVTAELECAAPEGPCERDVSLEIDGEVRDTKTVFLNESEVDTRDFEWQTGDGDAGDYTAEVIPTEGEPGSTTVRVNAPASFDVTIDNVDEPVTEGEDVTVAYTIENTGDVGGTQDVLFFVDETEEGRESDVELGGGGSFSGSFTYTTQSGDAPSILVEVVSEDSGSERQVTVNEPDPASFDVAITGTNDPVVAGETLDVTATVENTGDRTDSQEITLAIDGTTEDSTTVELAGGESETVTLSWDTQPGDAGDYTATVASDDDTDSTDVRVDAPANFAVTIDSTTSPAVEGETLDVTATVENTGDLPDTQEISLAIDGTTEEATTVDLAGGESTTLTLSWATQPGDAGEHTATVASDDDTDSTDVRVDAPANFAVTIDSTTSPAVEGETLDVTATVENTGDVSDTQEITLAIDGTTEDTTAVDLAGGESTTVTLSWDTQSGDAGDYTATVASEDDTDSTDVRVDAPANFEVAIDGTNSPVVESDPLTVTASVENTGDLADSQEITLAVDGTTEDTTAVDLAGGESTTVTLSWDTRPGDAGNYTATVASDDDTDSTDVRVNELANFTVDLVSVPSPILEGQFFPVTARIENVGDRAGSQNVAFRIDDEQLDVQTIELAGGEASDIQFLWTTGTGDAGEHTTTVSTANDTATREFRVLTPGSLRVEIESTNAPVLVGETLEVTATVRNVGDTIRDQPVELTVDGEAITSTEVGLGSGESTTVTLPWETAAGDAGEHTVTVDTDDDTDSTDVRVNAPANFAVDIESTNSPVVEGETLDVTATVRNAGDVEDSGSVGLTIDGANEGSTAVELAGGESTSVTLSWRTGTGDAGSYTAEISTDDDADTADVTVDEPREAGPPGGAPVFNVSVESTNTPVAEGETLEVTALVTNTGEETAAEQITLNTGGTDRESREVTLSGDESRSVTVTWETEAGDAGDYTATVAGEADEDSTGVAVREAGEESATFAVTIEDVSTPEDDTGTFEATATIENVNDTEDTQLVTLTTDGVERDSRELTLAGGESRTLSFSWEQDRDDADEEIDIEVASASDRDTSLAALGGDDGSTSAAIWLLLLLLLLLLVAAAYYYVRRRRNRGEPPTAEET